MDEIIGTKDSGKIITKSLFAGVVAISSSNLNRLRSSEGENFVTVEAIGRLCDHYKISAHWLVMGEGEIYNNKAVKTIETRIKSLEEAIKSLKSPKQKGAKN